MTNRLPGARVIAPLLWSILLLGIGLYAGTRLWRDPPGDSRPAIDEKLTVSILKSEALAFLAVRKITTQIVIDHSEQHWSGEWRGVLWAVVFWTYGVDLQGIGDQDIRREAGTLIVRLPKPQTLSFGVVPGTVNYISRSTALPKALDLLRGGSQRQVLESRVHEQAMAFATKQGLLPSRREIVDQLNAAVSALSSSTGLLIRFE